MVPKPLWRFWSTLGIRFKIAAILAAVLTVAILSLSLISLRQQRGVLEAETQGRVERMLENASTSARLALSGGDPAEFQEFLNRMGRRPDLVRLVVRDARGAVVADRFRKDSAAASANPHPAPEAVFRRARRDGEPVIDVRAPVYGSERAGRPLGSVELVFSGRRMEEAIGRQRKILFSTAAALILAGVLLSFPLGALLTRNITALAVVMEELSQGRPDRLVRLPARDEMGRLVRSFNRMVLKMREKALMERYLSISTLRQVRRMRHGERVKLGGERRRVAVLFSDIRGFTELAERMPAEEVVETLNIYLNTQAEVIHKRGGAVDKFVGDQVMAIFTGENAEFKAALSAQEICNFILSLNEARARRKLPLMSAGVGLNAGEVVMGNMGAERQMDYTVVGDPINTAARLCGKARPGQVVMSWPVLSALAGRCRWGMLERMAVKGKRLPVEVYELMDVPGAARQNMRRHVNRSAWAQAEDHSRFTIRIDDLSRTGCAVELAEPIMPGSELELDLPKEILGSSALLRAEVCHLKRRTGFYRAGLRFKGVAEELSHSITEWVHRIDLEMAAQSA